MLMVLIKAIGLLVLPALVLWGGILLMSKLSGFESVKRQPADAATAQELGHSLQARFSGYKPDEVETHWQALAGLKGVDGLSAERRLLEIDLIFPFLYGGALAASLLLAWAALARPFNPAWAMAPVLITVLADWTENIVLLNQIKRFGAAGLQAGWIQAASLATTVKIFFLIATLLLLLVLVVRMFFQPPQPS